MKVLFLGDSMSEVTGLPNRLCASKALAGLLKRKYGDGGQGFVGWDLGWDSPTFWRAQITNAMGMPSLLKISDGPDGLCYQQGIWWAPSGPINRFGLFVLANRMGGIISVRHVGPGVDEKFPLISGYSGTQSLLYTNWPIALSGSNYFFITQVWGQNILWPEATREGAPGVADYYWSRGGTTVAATLSVGELAFKQMVSAVHPQLIVWHSKHFGDAVDSNNASNVSYCINLASAAAKNASIAMVGTPPDALGSEKWNPTIQEMCRTNGWHYLDLSTLFPDYSKMVEAGYMLDGIHPTIVGGEAWGAGLYQLLGFPANLSSQLQVCREGSNLILTFIAEACKTYRVSASLDLAHWSPLMSITPAASGPVQFLQPIQIERPAFYRIEP